MAALSADCSTSQPPACVAKVARHPDGKVRVHFNAKQGSVDILEASANLADWEKIGVVVDSGSGELEVNDGGTPRAPARFYRLVAP